MTMARSIIGRPQTEDMTPFAKGYIEQVEGENLLEALNATLLETLRLYQGMDETIGNYRYAAGKWTLKEVLLHIIDTERIFSYRALTMARNDKSPLPGFEQDDYVPASKAESRTLKSLVEEYEVVRKGSIILLENMDDEMLDRKGTANNQPMTARIIGWMMAGHDLHHNKVVRTRYMTALTN